MARRIHMAKEACASALLLLRVLAAATPAHADPLTGDVGAVMSTLDGVSANPANAAFLDRTQIGISPELYHSDTLQIRYPGFDSVSSSDSGLASPLALGRPGFIWKPTPRLGIGGYAIPPIGLGLTVHKSGIPVVVLDTQNFVDLDAKGELKGAAEFTLGYKVGDRLGLGFNASYQKIAYRATLTPSDTTEPLATIDAEQSDLDLDVGARFDITPGVFALGVAFGLVNVHSERTTIDSPLIGSLGGGGADAGGGGGQGGANASIANPASSFLIGAMLARPQTFRLFADARYQRVNKTATGFSIVALKTKTKDVHDTLSARVGAGVSLSPQTELLAGGRYEPASLGAGSRGDDGTVGFGTNEVVQIFAGLTPLVPFWQVAGGAQFQFDYRAPRAPRAHREHKDREKAKSEKGSDAAPAASEGYYAWTVAAGLSYRRASLGIDENGEQPGAYLQTHIAIPLTVTRRF